jgi:hypothetical protein
LNKREKKAHDVAVKALNFDHPVLLTKFTLLNDHYTGCPDVGGRRSHN